MAHEGFYGKISGTSQPCKNSDFSFLSDSSTCCSKTSPLFLILVYFLFLLRPPLYNMSAPCPFFITFHIVFNFTFYNVWQNLINANCWIGNICSNNWFWRYTNQGCPQSILTFSFIRISLSLHRAAAVFLWWKTFIIVDNMYKGFSLSFVSR